MTGISCAGPSSRRRRCADAAKDSNLPLDWENLAEEIESLGKSLRRELSSQLRRVLRHLFKLEASPADRPRAGWRATITAARADIAEVLEQAPESAAGSCRNSREAGTNCGGACGGRPDGARRSGGRRAGTPRKRRVHRRSGTRRLVSRNRRAVTHAGSAAATPSAIEAGRRIRLIPPRPSPAAGRRAGVPGAPGGAMAARSATRRG